MPDDIPDDVAEAIADKLGDYILEGILRIGHPLDLNSFPLQQGHTSPPISTAPHSPNAGEHRSAPNDGDGHRVARGTA